MKDLSPAEAAQRALSALAAKGLPPTAPNFLSQFREITGTAALPLSSDDAKDRTEQVLSMMGTLLDAVTHASTGLQNDLAAFSRETHDMISKVAQHTDPEAANELFHALSASASWLLHELSTTRRELSDTQSQLAKVRDELAQARDLALADALTGLPNRRGLDFALTHEMARTRRNKLPLSVAILGLDHFKVINDQHGHAVGDVVLRHVAALIKQKLRTSDIFARYGGDEFAVILPETQYGGGEIMVSRLLDALKRTPAIWEEQLFTVSASAGVTQWFPGESAQAMLDRADQALDCAKRAGHGRVVCAAIPEIAK